MRNLALSPNATFVVPWRWTRDALPISLPWRNRFWHVTLPALWALGWLFWMWMMSIETPQHGAIVHGLAAIGTTLILALAAAWWVMQWVHRRIAGTLVVNDDYLEWQFPTSSEVELLADCGRFEFVGKGSPDAIIGWDLAMPEEEAIGGSPQPTKRRRLLPGFKSDRTLHATDLGLDRDELKGLCTLLNQLRDEAAARR